MGLNKPVQKIVRQTDLDGRLIKIGVLLLSGLFILLDLLLLELLDLVSKLFAETIFVLLGLLNHIANRQVRDTIAVGKQLREVGLA